MFIIINPSSSKYPTALISKTYDIGGKTYTMLENRLAGQNLEIDTSIEVLPHALTLMIP